VDIGSFVCCRACYRFPIKSLGIRDPRESAEVMGIRGLFYSVVGFLLPIAGLASLFKRPRLAGVLAIVNAASLFFTAPADQAKFFFKVSPPTAVTIGEFVLVLVGIGYMLCGQRIYLEKATN